MNIPLTNPQLRQYVGEQISAGHFASAEEVVEAGIARLMLDPPAEQLDAEMLAAIERADGKFDRGEDRPFSEVAAELRARP